MGGRRCWIGLAMVVLGLVGATAPASGAAATGPKAVIRRTAHGIPHILGRNWEDVGYGYGYAFAQDDLCPMAEDYVTVRGQRSRWFGPTGTYRQRGNRTTPNNLNSDFFYQRAINTRVVAKLLAKPS